MYVFPNIDVALRAKRARNDADFCEQLLDATGVALVPGSAFRAPGSFAASEETLDDALRCIETAHAKSIECDAGVICV